MEARVNKNGELVANFGALPTWDESMGKTKSQNLRLVSEHVKFEREGKVCWISFTIHEEPEEKTRRKAKKGSPKVTTADLTSLLG